jgi:hypothetical protein
MTVAPHVDTKWKATAAAATDYWLTCSLVPGLRPRSVLSASTHQVLQRGLESNSPWLVSHGGSGFDGLDPQAVADKRTQRIQSKGRGSKKVTGRSDGKTGMTVPSGGGR